MKVGGILIRVLFYLQATVIDKSLQWKSTASKPFEMNHPKKGSAYKNSIKAESHAFWYVQDKLEKDFGAYKFLTKEWGELSWGQRQPEFINWSREH